MKKSLLLLCGITFLNLIGCHQMQQNLGMGFYIPDDKKYMPKMDKSRSLLGVDQNKNGIRDDIDSYIQTRLVTPEQIKNAELLARGLQEPLQILATSKSKAEVLNRREEHNANIKEIIERNAEVKYPLNEYKLFKTIHSLTYNTKMRRHALYAFEQCHFNDDYISYLEK